MFRIRIIVVLLTLILSRSKVIENANTIIRETQVIPKLLTLLRANLVDSLTFYDDMVVNKKVQSMFVRNHPAMKVGMEDILSLVGYTGIF